jgi:ABC-type transporter Mla MlaB component
VDENPDAGSTRRAAAVASGAAQLETIGGPPVTLLRVGVIDDAGVRVVALHGRLDVDSLAAFAGIAAELSPGARCDLTELKSTDDVGVVVLAHLRNRGVELVGVSPYLELLLEHAREEPK